MEQESQQKAQEEQTRQRHPGAVKTANALVILTDVYGTEKELNEDALNGWEPGTTANMRRQAEAREKAHRVKIAAEEARLIAGGMNEDDAWYVARGMSLPSLRRVEEDKPETARERRRREGRERSWQEREWRTNRKDEQRRSNPAYQAGQREADDISLHQQVDHEEVRKIK